MQWNGTDNFGNLVMAESEARSKEPLEVDLVDMVGVVFHRHPDNVTFSIDVDFAQISAPSGLNVTHILNLPWIAERLESGEPAEALQAELTQALQSALKSQGREAAIQGPWED
ncbi:MAG TPA: hypothetical protein PLO61_08830 [Fimbriimonadaceae bacterium]|nr:hypothetical protein [Fimbriimonadaceae bacterium]HRJ33601.1 hypothetical protein [Fimbriimonadaceae bacterium]